MPRIAVDYTNNLLDYRAFNPTSLLTKINKALLDTGLFGDNDIRSFASGYDTYAVSTEPQGKAFLFVTLSILSGRSPEDKRKICDSIMKVLQENVHNGGWLDTSISVEIRDMDKENFSKGIVS